MIYLNCVNCAFYGLKSKKVLKHLLRIQNNNLLKQDYIASLYLPYIQKEGNTRLIEPPKEELKEIQRRIKKILEQIVVPDNVYSGVKGKSYVNNAKTHTGSNRKNLLKIDLKSFFPSIRRETVYRFFSEELCCSPDISEILTNLTTIDLEKAIIRNSDEVYGFLTEKGVDCNNHLVSGAPTSPIMSYLTNHRMFDEMQKVADANDAVMTVYIDDVIFSSEKDISSYFKERIIGIIKKYGYHVSKNKVKRYSKTYPKLVTGVVIDASGKSVIKNSIRLNIIKEFKYLRNHPDDFDSRRRLKGLLSAARQVDKSAFPSIYKYAFKE